MYAIQCSYNSMFSCSAFKINFKTFIFKSKTCSAMFVCLIYGQISCLYKTISVYIFRVNSHQAAWYELYTRTISATSLVYIVIYGTIHTKQHALCYMWELFLSQVSTIHTKQHAICYMWELFLSQVRFYLSSMVLFTPSSMLYATCENYSCHKFGLHCCLWYYSH